LVNEEIFGVISFAVGGAILAFMIGFYERADTGPIVYFTVLGFLAFLLIGFGLSSIVRAAASPSRT